MSAPNFSVKCNARNIYAFNMYSDFVAYCKENAELNESTCEELLNSQGFYYDWYQTEKDYYLESLERALKDKFGYNADFEDASPSDGDVFATIEDTIQFARCEIPVRLSIVFHAGYYDGFSLDWEISRISDCFGWDEVPDLDGCQEILTDECELNKGLAAALAKKLQNRLDAAVQKLGDEISDVIESIAPHALGGVVLSNGEGIYFDARTSA